MNMNVERACPEGSVEDSEERRCQVPQIQFRTHRGLRATRGRERHVVSGMYVERGERSIQRNSETRNQLGGKGIE